jgi:MFS family permease
MRAILQKRELRYVFAANMVSMVGSGMNSSAVAWYILQKTHSEVALGTFAVLQTLPAMLLMPFSGVLIDREDRRWLVMALDAARGIIILTVAILAFKGRAQLWQVYLMNTLVAAGFWMFWPTVTALIQELTPGEEFVHANTFLMAGIQGGWTIAGAIVGFVYNHIGLGGVLLIDFSTYVVSFLCYLGVRSGRHVVPRPAEIRADLIAEKTDFQNFIAEMREGIHFLKGRPTLMLLGGSWALFLGAMLTGVVVIPPLSEKIFHAGAYGYGWLNASWGVGAFLTALYAPKFIAKLGARRSIALSMGALAIGMSLAPVSGFLIIAVMIFWVMGTARGLSGIAMSTSLMEQVPPHFMGRVQNAFYCTGTALQIVIGFVVGAVSQYNLIAGFAVIGLVYALSFACSSWPIRTASGTQPSPAD